jgi:hypothetical protein
LSVINQVPDAAIDFSAQFLPVKGHAAESVRHPGLYGIDIESALTRFVGLDGCCQKQAPNQRENRLFHR